VLEVVAVESRIANPYRPGFNQPPVVFAGRTDVIDGAREALQVAALDGRTPRPLVLLGIEGLDLRAVPHPGR
jgi:hypothetical protein